MRAAIATGLAVASAFALVATAGGCGNGGAPPMALPDARLGAAGSEPPSEDLSPRLRRRFQPIVAATTSPEDAALVDLGRLLYYDRRLSASGTVSCNKCHPLTEYGVTGDVLSVGVHGQQGQRNAPSTYHASGHFRQFWDGRTPNVEEQAKSPLTNPVEMGMTPEAVVDTLRSIPGYVEQFARAYPGQPQPISFDNVGIAIGAFERGLVTPSRWDRYLQGDTKALTSAEKDGAKLFANLGCVVCHTGAYLGGAMFEKLGARVPWPNQRDAGRELVTGSEADRMMFKVPSLRNVAKTAPYFHDGSAATLEMAVRLMAHHQLDEDPPQEEIDAIVIWLGSLTGDIPEAYIAEPTLPPGPGSP